MQKFKNINKKFLKGGAQLHQHVPKLGVSGVKLDTAKINIGCGICWILVEYSVFFHWKLSL